MNMVVFRRCQSALGVAAVMALALVASLVFAGHAGRGGDVEQGGCRHVSAL